MLSRCNLNNFHSLNPSQLNSLLFRYFKNSDYSKEGGNLMKTNAFTLEVLVSTKNYDFALEGWASISQSMVFVPKQNR